MPYTITTQKSTPRAFYPPVLHTLSNLTAARKGAQIVANSRRAFTILWHGTPGAYTRRDFFAPKPEPIMSAGAYWTETERRERTPVFRRMRAHQKECGKNAGLSVAVYRMLYQGRRLSVIGTEYGRHIIDEHGERIARIEHHIRPGKCSVTVRRAYDFASTNPGQPVISGGYCIAVTNDGKTSHAYTWQGSHECSAYPVPESEKLPADLCQISR